MKKILIFIVLLLFPGVVLYASYQDALKLFEQKDYKESLKMIANELETSNDFKPDSPNYNLRFLAAHNHWKLGTTKSAIDHFNRCIEIKKNNVIAYIDLALLLIELKRYAEADATARRGLEVEKSPMLLYIMGIASLKRENFWKAKEMFEKANSLNPELYYSYNALGITLMGLNKISEANTAFSAAYAIKPRSLEIINNLGISYEKLGKNKEAYEYFKKALSMDEKNSVVSANFERIKAKIKN